MVWKLIQDEWICCLIQNKWALCLKQNEQAHSPIKNDAGWASPLFDIGWVNSLFEIRCVNLLIKTEWVDSLSNTESQCFDSWKRMSPLYDTHKCMMLSNFSSYSMANSRCANIIHPPTPSIVLPPIIHPPTHPFLTWHDWLKTIFQSCLY